MKEPLLEKLQEAEACARCEHEKRLGIEQQRDELLAALEELERVYETGDFDTEFKPALTKARAIIANQSGGKEMTDREMLELAAKAAGVEWNPLTDDGDALRLAVKLGICYFDGDLAVCFGADGRNITEPFGIDPYAATRRAIVRAAAEIGRDME